MVRTNQAGVIAPLVIAAVLAGVAPTAWAQSFTLVNAPPETGSSAVYGLSADGSSAVGWKSGDVGFMWTATGGRNDFGIGLNPTRTFGISGDGRYAVGGDLFGGPAAFRWSQAGGYQNLGTLPGFTQSQANDASFDGSVVVGTLTTTTNGVPQAFRWTQTGGMQGLGVGTRAEAISGDGSVIVGTLNDAPIAMRWTQTGGAQQLQPLLGAGNSHARAVNFDGSIIVGNSSSLLLPTMWINGTPMELLSSVPNSSLTPYGVSDAGDVVVGFVQNSTGPNFAGVWTQSTGTIRLSDYLIANGVTLPAGVTLGNCTAVSADGRTFAGIAGTASGFQGFVATVPEPGPIAFLSVGWLVVARRRRGA